MKIKILGLLILIICSLSASAQEKFTISGYIEDGASGEKLIAANIFDLKSLNGNTTNTYGFYSLTLPKDSVHLAFSYIGYQTQEMRLFLDKDMTINIKLKDELELSEITVTEKRLEKIEESAQMSRVEVPVAQIKKLPALLGEVDVMKTLQLLPGVQSGGEGQTGLYVRGGSPDQNLVLLDGVPIYNVSHVLGIFSVFNADAIKNVTLTKGGFPARFGGRLSSVLEINMKEGNMQEFHGEGSIGLISSKLTLEGPIKKDKASFLISGRRTYADLIFKPIIKASASEGQSIDPTLYFYDLNAKFQYKVNDKHRLFLSWYNGSDVFFNRYQEENTTAEGGIDWGNVIGALRWNYEINNKLFANTTLTLSNYDIDIRNGLEFKRDDGTTNKFSAKYLSGIKDFGGKVDFDYIPNPTHYIRFGVGATHHTYSPGALSFEVSSGSFGLDTLIGQDQLKSMEYSVYVEDDMKLGALRANLGVHASAFKVGDKTYTSVQPRIGLRYLLNNDWAVKGAFSTMAQYLNLLTSESLSLPTDLWVPSTELIKPQTSWQAAGGVARTLWDEYEFSVEGFYKQMKNVVSYKEGASFFNGFASDWQTKITQGDGEAYGAEVFLQKKKGNTTGWIGYTLSWNNRTFDEINGGKTFPFRYDRRHDISVVVSHQFTKRISASAAWVYGTGNAISLPVTKYQTQQTWATGDPNQPFVFWNDEVELLGDKNAFRMSDYHRLDLSIEFFKKMKKHERRWIFSVYNAYWNKNPYYIISDTQIDQTTGESKDVLKEISILPIIPSFSYSFKF